MKCKECGFDFEAGTGTEPYAHVLTCFHLENKGVRQLREENKKEVEPRQGRINHILDMAERAEPQPVGTERSE